MPRWSLSQCLLAFVTLPTLILLALGWLWLDDPALFLKEGQMVEVCSALLLIQGIGCWFAVKGREGWRAWQIPAILALFALREMDVDKRFTDSGLLKLRTYTGDAPLPVKLLGACVLFFSLVVVWRIARRNALRWARDLRAGKPYALAVLLAAGLTGTGKALDGLGRKLLDVGIVISGRLDARAGQAEEAFELLAWWLLCLAIAGLPAARAPRREPAPALATPRD